MFSRKGNIGGQNYGANQRFGPGVHNPYQEQFYKEPLGPGYPANQPMFEGMNYNQQAPYSNAQGPLYPNMQFERLQLDIRENRRRINNLTKRIIRLENYLRIRDTSDYVNLDEDQVPNEFSM